MQKRWIKIKPVGEYSSPHWLFHIQRRCFSHIVDVRYFVIGLSRKSEPKRIIISASDASSLLCVTTITHFFSLWAISFRISITSQAVASSRLPVGSSAKRTFASLAKARARLLAAVGRQTTGDAALPVFLADSQLCQKSLGVSAASQLDIFNRRQIVNQVVALKDKGNMMTAVFC